MKNITYVKIEKPQWLIEQEAKNKIHLNEIQHYYVPEGKDFPLIRFMFLYQSYSSLVPECDNTLDSSITVKRSSREDQWGGCLVPFSLGEEYLRLYKKAFVKAKQELAG